MPTAVFTVGLRLINHLFTSASIMIGLELILKWKEVSVILRTIITIAIETIKIISNCIHSFFGFTVFPRNANKECNQSNLSPLFGGDFSFCGKNFAMMK